MHTDILPMTGSFGLHTIAFKKLEKYSHAFSGLIIFLCGFAIKFFGL